MVTRSLFAAVFGGALTVALVGPSPARSQDVMMGEIRLFAGNFAPRGWAFCEGQSLVISSNPALFSLIGTMYGGDGRATFALPDLRDAEKRLRKEADRDGPRYVIAVSGAFPSRDGHTVDALLAEVRLFAGNFAPRGWAACDGQLLPIASHDAVFSLMGTMYGGDGRTTFGLPNLKAAQEKLKPDKAGKDAATPRYVVAMAGLYPSRH